MNKLFKITLTLFAIIFLLLGFTLPLNPPAGNWYQQFLPTSLPNFQVSDITFVDSLTGWIVSGNSMPNDSSGYILKTTNGGDNWQLQLAEFRDFSRVKFLNANTGFVSGGYNTGARLYKTTNSGTNWFLINGPGGQIYYDDISVLNEDTIWIAINQTITGGIYRTTNGGANWTQQFSNTGSNPPHIYMYNARIGFMDGGATHKTTNGGLSWTPILGEGLFFDMHFVDSLTGWKCSGFMKKTTNGGINWVTQTLPSGGIILTSQMLKFAVLNRDTVWGVGGEVFYGAGQSRGMLYRTTNGGNNWLFQVPDTAIHSAPYRLVKFINKFNGWAYWPSSGIHTRLGGDTNFLTGVKQISSNIPNDYKLYQNYPNPFNPKTNIKYSLKGQTSNVKLAVFDITGKEVIELVNQEQRAGVYEVDFSGYGYSSGVYFYSLIVDDIVMDTKKMLLLK